MAGIGSPGVVAVEPLAEKQQAQSGFVCVGRLMSALMDDEAGDAVIHGHIGHVLQVSGIITPGVSGQACGGEGFRRGDVLPKDMGDGGRFPDVGLGHLQGGTAAGAGNPERAHRYGGRHLEVHAVPDVHAAVLVGLRVAALHPVFLCNSVDPVIIGGKEFAERLAPVEEESLAVFAAPDDLAGEDRKPGNEVVAAAGLELLRQRPGPCHLLSLVTVGQDVLDAMLPYHSSGCLLIHVHISMEIVHPGFPVQLVHFQAGRLGRSRMVLFAREGSAEPVYAPATCRNLPGKDTILDK